MWQLLLDFAPVSSLSCSTILVTILNPSLVYFIIKISCDLVSLKKFAFIVLIDPRQNNEIL